MNSETKEYGFSKELGDLVYRGLEVLVQEGDFNAASKHLFEHGLHEYVFSKDRALVESVVSDVFNDKLRHMGVKAASSFVSDEVVKQYSDEVVSDVVNNYLEGSVHASSKDRQLNLLKKRVAVLKDDTLGNYVEKDYGASVIQSLVSSFIYFDENESAFSLLEDVTLKKRFFSDEWHEKLYEQSVDTILTREADKIEKDLSSAKELLKVLKNHDLVKYASGDKLGEALTKVVLVYAFNDKLDELPDFVHKSFTSPSVFAANAVGRLFYLPYFEESDDSIFDKAAKLAKDERFGLGEVVPDLIRSVVEQRAIKTLVPSAKFGMQFLKHDFFREYILEDEDMSKKIIESYLMMSSKHRSIFSKPESSVDKLSVIKDEKLRSLLHSDTTKDVLNRILLDFETNSEYDLAIDTLKDPVLSYFAKEDVKKRVISKAVDHFISAGNSEKAKAVSGNLNFTRYVSEKQKEFITQHCKQV